MHVPKFYVSKINLGCQALNDHHKTVAYVSPQGYVDWILKSPDDPGSLLKAVKVEPHLCWVLGLKFNLHLPHLCEVMDSIKFEILDNGARARIIAQSHSADRRLRGHHRALIQVNPNTGRYQWLVETEMTCLAGEPLTLPWIEYNNVYPDGTGRCMLYAPEKRFTRTLMTDRDGTVWHFPHQHCMHYGAKIKKLHFAEGSLAGFFEEDLNPVVIIEKSTLPPDWAICDMYYDLHCGCRPQGPIEPGETHSWRYRIRYLDRSESRDLVGKAKFIPITAEDYERFAMPRLALGRNDLTEAVAIDDLEDASGFRQRPPVRVWDRDTGPEGKGALRITNETAAETVWSAEPPSQIPSRRKFHLSALVKTAGVVGKGMFLRVRYHCFRWRPEPHVEWVKTLESKPVAGTTDWTRVEVPELVVPEEHFDYLVWIDVVLDGQGVGWLTEVGVELQGIEAEIPSAPVRSRG